jgi:putative addiction module killer protein
MGGQPRIPARIYRTDEFIAWYSEQPFRVQTHIEARLERIESEGYFGVSNRFDGLIELKWGSGLRIYTHLMSDRLLLVLLGGNKNGQDKDIQRAKKILKRVLETDSLDI